MTPAPGPVRRGRILLLIGLALVWCGAWWAHAVQTAGGVRVQDVRFTGTGGTPMSAHLYEPPNATAATPAPGILAVHGYFNSREAQSGFAIEFSRRGYVVLALDQTGHGHSAPPAFANAFGAPDGLRYLRSLDIVDRANIGLEGHSMGGWAVVNAAAALPDGYRSMVLEGSSTGQPYAPEGSPTFPRNLAVVFSQYDEVPDVMWHVDAAVQAPRSAKLQQVFGTGAPVQPGRLYGSIEQGTARVLYTPPITHPMDHFSPTAIGHAIDWFQRTLVGGLPLPPDDQVWYWKEAGTGLALIGLLVFVLGWFDLLLQVPVFAPLVGSIDPAAALPAPRDRRWWAAFVLGVLVPALTYLPLCRLGGELWPPSAWAPQAFSNEVVFWALCNAAWIALVSRCCGAPRMAALDQPLRAFALAATVFAGAYALVAMVAFCWTVDLRVWFMAFKPMSPWQAQAFPLYAAGFAVFFTVALGSLQAVLWPAVRRPAAQYAVAVASLAGGFVAFVAVQYGALFGRFHLITFHLFDPLRIIVSINFLPVMGAVAVLSTFAWQRTGRRLPGALLCGFLVGWYMVVGQATQGA
jgi:pimeloyl-ACP methyl ester carboxylesterase